MSCSSTHIDFVSYHKIFHLDGWRDSKIHTLFLYSMVLFCVFGVKENTIYENYICFFFFVVIALFLAPESCIYPKCQFNTPHAITSHVCFILHCLKDISVSQQYFRTSSLNTWILLSPKKNKFCFYITQAILQLFFSIIFILCNN